MGIVTVVVLANTRMITARGTAVLIVPKGALLVQKDQVYVPFVIQGCMGPLWVCRRVRVVQVLHLGRRMDKQIQVTVKAVPLVRLETVGALAKRVRWDNIVVVIRRTVPRAQLGRVTQVEQVHVHLAMRVRSQRGGGLVRRASLDHGALVGLLSVTLGRFVLVQAQTLGMVLL
jgi:hypothetical protein